MAGGGSHGGRRGVTYRDDERWQCAHDELLNDDLDPEIRMARSIVAAIDLFSIESAHRSPGGASG